MLALASAVLTVHASQPPAVLGLHQTTSHDRLTPRAGDNEFKNATPSSFVATLGVTVPQFESPGGCARFVLVHYADRFNMTFVHVPKAGGTTVEAALGVHGSCHATAATFRALDPKGWAGRMTFAMVRDPLDRLVSLFEYGRHGGNGTPHDAKKFGWLTEITFGQFVDELTRGKGIDWWYGAQTSFVGPCTQDKCAVDVLLRLDNLTNGWAALRHSLPALPPLPAARERVTPHRAWCCYYRRDDAALRKATALYWDDFALAGVGAPESAAELLCTDDDCTNEAMRAWHDAEGLDMLSDDTAELVSQPASSFVGRTTSKR